MEHLATRNAQKIWTQSYYPSFNGLRGVAILAVFVCHYGPFLTNSELVAWSWIGVDLFFVLSGFLITGVLFDSISSPIYYRSFYVRRALRIFPVYYGLIFLVYLATWLSHSVQVKKTFALNLMYVANLALPHLDWQTQNPTTIRFLYYPTKTALEATVGIFWSLCVEEHFYLLWPLILRRLGTRERIMRFCLKGVIATIALRVLLLRVCSAQALAHHLLYVSTYTRWDELLMGSWCALWLRGRQLSQASLRIYAYTAIFLSVVVVSCGALLVKGGDVNHITNPFVSTLGFSLIGVAAMGILLLSLDLRHPWARLLMWSPLRELGKVSYGVYLLHMLPLPIFVLFLNRRLNEQHLALVAMIAVLLLVFGVAWISFRYFERPILRLKTRLAPRSESKREPGSRDGAVSIRTDVLSSGEPSQASTRTRLQVPECL